MSIRILLADDQQLIRAGFSSLLSAEPDLEVVGEAATGRDAVALVKRERPDVVLMDIRMPDGDGLWATEQIVADPQLDGTRVVVVTTFELDDYVAQAIRAGASGFLGKGTRSKALVDGIRTVAAGDALLSPQATRGLIARVVTEPVAPRLDTETFAVLTDREREMVALVARGLSNDEIATREYLSPLTVKTHINRAMMKLGVRDRAQLVVLAYEGGLIQPGHQS